MSSSELVDIVYIMAFCLGGMSFALGPFVIVFFLAPRITRNTVGKTVLWLPLYDNRLNKCPSMPYYFNQY